MSTDKVAFAVATRHVHHEPNPTLRRGSGSTGELATERTPDERTGVVTAAVRAEQRRQLLSTIECLEPIDRAVLLLRGVEQRSQATTAALRGISGDAVAMRFSRALDRLRAQLPSSLPGDLGAA